MLGKKLANWRLLSSPAKAAGRIFLDTARLELAQLVVQGKNVLLLDEPINHLDIPSREQFEQALANVVLVLRSAGGGRRNERSEDEDEREKGSPHCLRTSLAVSPRHRH